MWQTVQNPSKASECPQTTATGSAEASEAAAKPDVVGDMSISPRKKNHPWQIPQPLENPNASAEGFAYT